MTKSSRNKVYKDQLFSTKTDPFLHFFRLKSMILTNEVGGLNMRISRIKAVSILWFPTSSHSPEFNSKMSSFSLQNLHENLKYFLLRLCWKWIFFINWAQLHEAKNKMVNHLQNFFSIRFASLLLQFCMSDVCRIKTYASFLNNK